MWGGISHLFSIQDHADGEENVKAKQAREQVGFNSSHEIVPRSNERLNYNKSGVLFCVPDGIESDSEQTINKE